MRWQDGWTLGGWTQTYVTLLELVRDKVLSYNYRNKTKSKKER